MKKTLQDQYLLIKEGKGHVGVFLAEAKREFPHIVRNAATFDEAVASLKTKNIISENVMVVIEQLHGFLLVSVRRFRWSSLTAGPTVICVYGSLPLDR